MVCFYLGAGRIKILPEMADGNLPGGRTRVPEELRQAPQFPRI